MRGRWRARRAGSLVTTAGLIALALAAVSAARPDDDPSTPAAQSGSNAPSSQPAAPPDRAALERGFEQMLDGVVLRGSWQMTGAAGLAGRAPLGEPRPERYTILGVERALDDNWLITARIQYAEHDATLPVMVRVVWAGDTPVVTVDDFKFLAFGPYSARVVFYRNFYSGLWFGPTYGGVMSGQLVKLADEAAFDAAGRAPASQPAGVAPQPGDGK